MWRRHEILEHMAMLVSTAFQTLRVWERDGYACTVWLGGFVFCVSGDGSGRS
jgi:hypothetical protein